MLTPTSADAFGREAQFRQLRGDLQQMGLDVHRAVLPARKPAYISAAMRARARLHGTRATPTGRESARCRYSAMASDMHREAVVHQHRNARPAGLTRATVRRSEPSPVEAQRDLFEADAQLASAQGRRRVVCCRCTAAGGVPGSLQTSSGPVRRGRVPRARAAPAVDEYASPVTGMARHGLQRGRLDANARRRQLMRWRR